MHTGSFSLKADEQVQIINITDEVQKIINNSDIDQGFAVVFTGHVTACLSVNEDDPELLEDMKENLLRLVPLEPEEGSYRHNEKYSGMPPEQNTHAHILATMIKPSLMIPIENGKLKLGTWQDLFFIELDMPKDREISVQVWGE